jgi:hypothetical protein
MSIRIVLRWIALSALCICTLTHAANFPVGGSVQHLLGNGLQLKLVDSAGCLADGTSFTLHSTDTNDCFTPTNFTKCCSQSIRFTASDGISTVTCTCGVVIIPSPESSDQKAVDATQLIALNAGASAFAFPTPIADISNYSVSIAQQPSTPSQRCAVSRAAGIVNGQSITNIYLNCADAIFADGFDAR